MDEGAWNGNVTPAGRVMILENKNEKLQRELQHLRVQLETAIANAHMVNSSSASEGNVKEQSEFRPTARQIHSYTQLS